MINWTDHNQYIQHSSLWTGGPYSWAKIMLVINSVISVFYNNIWKCQKRRGTIFRRAISIRNSTRTGELKYQKIPMSIANYVTKFCHNQQLILTLFFNSVIKAEMIWSLFSVCEGFSNNSAKYLNQTFQSMFSEWPTAQKFQSGPRSP